MLTIIPFWVSWLVFSFVLGLLSKYGGPVVSGLANVVSEPAPWLARWIESPWFSNGLAALWVLAFLYVIGWAATRVVGRRLLSAFERMINHIPVAKKIYGSTKRLLDALQQKPDSVQRVVLVEFPTPNMRAVGLVTRTFRDSQTGKYLAAVYVPTTPNPTSGYLEIVPLDRVTSTDWTIDEAMTFIISGGAVAPDHIAFDGAPPPAQPQPAASGVAAAGPGLKRVKP